MRIQLKSKFDPLLKGLKQKLQACELSIAQINQQIAQKQEEIREFSVLISQIQVPASGNVLLFKESYEGKRVYLEMIDACGLEISALKNERKKKQEEYKEQCLELEKIQYLWNKEMQEKLRLLKAKEQKELDEIAMMRFKKWREGDENP